MADGFLQCVRSDWLCATFAERLPVFYFSLFVREIFDESSGRKSLVAAGFDQNFMFRTQHIFIFPYSILSHYYYARSNSMK